MTTSYYSTCKYPLSALARYTLLEVLNVFSLCSNGMSVVPTNGSPLVPPTFNKPPPRTAPDMSTSHGSTPGLSSRHLLHHPRRLVDNTIQKTRK